ncbi:unnamed protein product [Rotaria magnacalcarata]|uniref:Uncharacterized protein n=1 Tax=Rotaria magnacalcarata TaxID=392030 RepID=A0A815CEF2_9BILA|nr:unnamed protein product [Rotaria magnacalcarata]CAF1282475.1 unnamed protein product [Rotaria magnacalcarata]CAF2066510.1 unnamed protein product [Rotaria magnacalcarata]CAF2082722.1 unnamed protein product [Rotaria magnacalcarata]CAF4290331.1 unnamed protein product [Rotaria magnacalcarata]
MRKLKRVGKFLLLIILISLCLIIIKIQFYSFEIHFDESKELSLNRKNKFDITEYLNNYPYPLCSERSIKHGYNQKVIAVSSYESDRDNINLTNKVWYYTLEFISEAKYFYPDWRVRIYYHNLNITNDEIYKIENYYKNVDFCSVYNIDILSNITYYMPGRFHRFIPIADRFVDIYMSRDIDSPIFKREVLSVNQWLLSDKIYHIMRDHPLHYDVILAGLWAFKLSKSKTMTNEIVENLFSKTILSSYNSMTGDQDFLKDYVWPFAQNHSMQYDSFHCDLYPLSIPFPISKLSNSQFVGCRRPCRYYQDPPGPCPIKCLLHKNEDTNLC